MRTPDVRAPQFVTGIPCGLPGAGTRKHDGRGLSRYRLTWHRSGNAGPHAGSSRKLPPPAVDGRLPAPRAGARRPPSGPPRRAGDLPRAPARSWPAPAPLRGARAARNEACDGFVLSGCTLCGDGVREGNEVCDTDDLGGESCQTRGFEEGGLPALTWANRATPWTPPGAAPAATGSGRRTRPLLPDHGAGGRAPPFCLKAEKVATFSA